MHQIASSSSRGAISYPFQGCLLSHLFPHPFFARSARSIASSNTMTNVADMLPLSPDGSRVLIVTHYLPFHATLAPAHNTVNQNPHTTPRHPHHHRPSIPSARPFRPYMNGSIPPTSPSPLLISSGSGGGGGGGGGGNTCTSADATLSPTTKDRSFSSSHGGSPSRSPADTYMSYASAAPSSPLHAGKSTNFKWHFTAHGDHSALNAVRILSSAEQTNHCIFIGLLDHFYAEDGQSIDANSLDEEQKQELTKAFLLEKRCVPVFIDPAVSSGHYEGFCKQGNVPSMVSDDP